MTEAARISDKAATTRFCARVIGPLMLIVGAIVLARFNDLVLMMPAILQDGPLSFITGIFALMAGLVLFVAHHHWSSAVAIAVSLIGLLTILRGVLLMLAPSFLAGIANTMLNLGPGALIAGAIAIVLGAWLTYAGWFAKGAA